ncbi:MAG: type II toxin-antitoxin system prevent-host-death family antitoxin [Acidobacteriota bacterium]|nr:type II toxin-antitoxin system prevent-host-death family antitoxin [Acidobacteriota bacterium]
MPTSRKIPASRKLAAIYEQVGIRELRQNLSVYVRRLRAGQRFEVTDRGQPVGYLVPLKEPSSAIGRLVASGLASSPEGDLEDLGMPLESPRKSLSEALAETRRERL